MRVEKNRAVKNSFCVAQVNNISAAWRGVAGNLSLEKQASCFWKMNSFSLSHPLSLSLSLSLSLCLSVLPCLSSLSPAVSRPPPHPPLWWIICAVGVEVADWLLWQVLNTDPHQCSTSILWLRRIVPSCVTSRMDVVRTCRHILCPSSDDRLICCICQTDGWIIGQCYLFNFWQ